MATQNAIGTDFPIPITGGGTGAATLTQYGVLVGAGTGAIVALAAATNGQLAIGSTGANPTIGSITSTDSSLTITAGAGTLVIEGTDATETQDGVVELATDAEALAGTDTVRAIVPTSLKAKLGTQTDHGVLVGSGDTAAVTALAVGTNGQVLVGSTGADCVFATIASADSSVVITGGAGTIDLSAVPESAVAINAQTGTTYTLVIADAGKLVTCDNAAAIALTVPPNSGVAYVVGTTILICQKGAGVITVTEGVAVTVESRGGVFDSAGQFAMLSIVKIATDTWYLAGDIA